MAIDRRSLGAWGERKAASYLRWRGYRILERNYRCRGGELDLIVCGHGALVFVEVKLRKDDSHGCAREFVHARKQQRLLYAAKYYLAHAPTELPLRFDVVEVYAPKGTATLFPKITHWKDAFA